MVIVWHLFSASEVIKAPQASQIQHFREDKQINFCKLKSNLINYRSMKLRSFFFWWNQVKVHQSILHVLRIIL